MYIYYIDTMHILSKDAQTDPSPSELMRNFQSSEIARPTRLKSSQYGTSGILWLINSF